MRLVLLLLFSVLAAGQDLPPVKDLARRVQKDKDGLDPVVLQQLGQHGTDEALTALERAMRVVKEDALRAELYQALAAFAGKPELGPRAEGLLENEVRKGKGAPARLAAARAILRFDPVELAKGWAARHKDDEVQLLFTDALVVARAASEDPDEVRAIFSGGVSLDAGVHYLGVERARRGAGREAAP